LKRFWIFDFGFSIEKSTSKRVFWLALYATFFALYSSAEGQQAKIYKIGWLGARSASAIGPDVIRPELRQLGYVEGKNMRFEFRFADDTRERLPALADELVHLNVDVLVTPAVTGALVLKKATKTIPIVFVGVSDPIATGLVPSLAQPGGNITGFTIIEAILAGKRLELLKETVPKLSRISVLWDPKNRGSEQSWKENRSSAPELGLQLHSMEVSTADGFETAFKEADKARSAALAVTLFALANSNQKRIAELAVNYRLPSIFSRQDFVESGGLMSYGANRLEPYRRAAVMIDKILKGVKPAHIPVEQPTKFEMLINLKTAKQIGLTVPPNVLARADRIIR
jgi:putative ABC transport system substrate-binding protein